MKKYINQLRGYIFKLRQKDFVFNDEKGNRLIGNLIKSNKPFAVARIGIGEEHVIFNHLQNRDPQLERLNTAGVWDDSYEDFLREYIQGITDADLNIFWKGMPFEVPFKILNTYSPNSIKIPHRSLEPYYFKKPWSRHLKGKKVLVIHPFTDSIESQYKNRKKVWPNLEILPEFELITYESKFLNNLDEYKSWTDELADMKKDISKIDFDIALLACSTFGHPLISYIKEELGKGGIYVGGALQLFFGIKGARWTKEGNPEIFKLYNEYWVFPSKNETPSKEVSNKLDNSCYW